MDAHSRISQLLDWIDEAKAVPFSTSVIVNRDAFADELEALRDDLPSELREAGIIIGERDDVLARAHREADRIEADARAERQRLVTESEVYVEAERQADEIIGAARTRAHQLRVEADDYVDSKLAEFEIVLHKTLQTVERGRVRLADRLRGHEDADPSADGSDASEDGDARMPLYDHEAL